MGNVLNRNGWDENRTRLAGLDAARFVAFVGMVIVNFKIAMGADGEAGGLGFLTQGVEGKAAATFVVLAGIGLGLSGRKDASHSFWITLRRAAFLMVIGLLNMIVFDADILHYYAVYFLFGAVLLRAGTPALLGSVLALNLAFVVMILALNYDAGWNWEEYAYADFWTPVGFVRNLFFNGWHPVVPWLGFLLFGIVLSRAALGTRTVQLQLIGGGVLAVALAEATSAGLGPVLGAIDPELVPLATTSPIPPMPLYTMAGLGAACFVVGICLISANWLEQWGILSVVAPAGRQTLTLYVAHIFIGMGTLEALGMLGGQTVARSVLAAGLFCLLALIYARVWSRWFPRGPIEALMRRTAG